MIRSYWLDPEGKFHRDLDPEALRQAYATHKGTLWVDFEDPTPDEVKLLGEGLFGFHPLAVEDCLHALSFPKVDDYDDYLYLVFHAWNRGTEGVRLEELDSFLGKHYLVTYHVETRRSVAEVADRLDRDPKLFLGGGADMLLHQILDRMVDRYNVVVDDVDERVDRIEEEILENPDRHSLREILQLKKDLQNLFRTVRHQRDVVHSLSREGHPAIGKKARQFFRDVYDHVVRVHDTVEGLRDEVAGARDAYLTVISNRMNEVMKRLTLISTIILPLTFVTGIYGMNFTWMPLLEESWGFAFVCGAMVALAAGMVYWFRRKRWA